MDRIEPGVEVPMPTELVAMAVPTVRVPDTSPSPCTESVLEGVDEPMPVLPFCRTLRILPCEPEGVVVEEIYRNGVVAVVVDCTMLTSAAPEGALKRSPCPPNTHERPSVNRRGIRTPFSG